MLKVADWFAVEVAMGKNKKKKQGDSGRKSSGAEASVGYVVEEIWKCKKY